MTNGKGYIEAAKAQQARSKAASVTGRFLLWGEGTARSTFLTLFGLPLVGVPIALIFLVVYLLALPVALCSQKLAVQIWREGQPVVA